MSRDFDKAQEMVWASMEYVKVLGFRLRRTEVQRDDWKKVAQSHADEMIKLRQHVDALGEHIGNAIDALKKERDELATRLRQSIARGDFAEMRLATLAAELETERERHRQTAAVPQSVDVPRTHPVPCDPPEATHITPDGKATAQAAVTPQPGDVVRLVRVPTLKEYPHDSGCWEPNWGGIDDHMRVHYVGSNITGTRVVRAVFGLEWPLSCVEVVKGGEQ
jgi:DNA-binding helix-hairpin-helix protein with protein kinase domain